MIERYNSYELLIKLTLYAIIVDNIPRFVMKAVPSRVGLVGLYGSTPASTHQSQARCPPGESLIERAMTRQFR